MLRILFLGENWYGSNSRSCCAALRRQGHNVLDVDCQDVFPQVRGLGLRALMRLFRPGFVREYNDLVLSTAQRFRPDLLLTLKGSFLMPSTLRKLRDSGVSLYNYYPDTSAFAHDKWIPRALPEYDCVFYTKPFWVADVSKKLSLKASFFLPHGYDPELHRIVELQPEDIEDYGYDVSLIAIYTAHKEAMLKELVALRPDINLRIWGNGWREHARSSAVKRFTAGTGLLGETYARAIRASRINLGIMSGKVKGSSSGDLTTSRTYTIPACGGFMLHERNSEVLDLYEENKEIACFGSVAELAEKVDYYLAHPDQREAIRLAGHNRCVPAYSYDSRMATLLAWHREHATKEEAYRGFVNF